MSNNEERERIGEEIVRKEKSSDPFVSAVRATRMPMLITDPSRPDNPIIFANDAFARLTGYSREETLGQNCRFLQGPETSRDDVAKIRSAVERRVPIEIELLNHKKNGEFFWNRLLISPVFDNDGDLTFFFASQFDVTLERERLSRLQADRDALEREVDRRTQELTRSESLLHYALRAAGLGTWTLDLEGRRFMASSLCKAMFGRAPDDPFGYDDLLAAISPEDRPRVTSAIEQAIARRSEYRVEYQIVTPENERRWIEDRGQPAYRADGTPLSMAGVSIDVTARKRSDEHRALLAAELNHRVKNSMATMQSIAYQTLRHAATLDEARQTLDARLLSMSAAHDVLTRQNWDSATLSEIATTALNPFDTDHRRFRIGGPCVRLKPSLALAMMLALHELATNAVKYGALSNDTGRVLLSWESGRTGFWLRWEETGGPKVEPPRRSGFGSRMIERALGSELRGSARIEYRASGVVFTVEAPSMDQTG